MSTKINLASHQKDFEFKEWPRPTFKTLLKGRSISRKYNRFLLSHFLRHSRRRKQCTIVSRERWALWTS